jgi:hypothetical protein
MGWFWLGGAIRSIQTMVGQVYNVFYNESTNAPGSPDLKNTSVLMQRIIYIVLREMMRFLGDGDVHYI